MIGQTVSHYMIPEKLGEGGMGVVYKAAGSSQTGNGIPSGEVPTHYPTHHKKEGQT